MLNRLPKHPGELASLLADIGNPSTVEVACALGVSRRTVERWKRGKTPRVALLSLWWLSHEGHREWDCEMANRTRLALDMNAALWRQVKKNRLEVAQNQLSTASAWPANDTEELRRA